MNFTEQYSKELFDRINSYRNDILNFLKSTNNHYKSSEINLTVPFFLSIIKVGAAHWELLIFFNTPIFINVLTSFLRVGT